MDTCNASWLLQLLQVAPYLGLPWAAGRLLQSHGRLAGRDVNRDVNVWGQWWGSGGARWGCSANGSSEREQLLQGYQLTTPIPRSAGGTQKSRPMLSAAMHSKAPAQQARQSQHSSGASYRALDSSTLARKQLCNCA